MLGYLAFDPDGAHLVFQLVSRRDGQPGMLMTGDKAAGTWGNVARDAVIATAIRDRLLHRSHVVAIRVESYRLRGMPPRRPSAQGRPGARETIHGNMTGAVFVSAGGQLSDVAGHRVGGRRNPA